MSNFKVTQVHAHGEEPPDQGGHRPDAPDQEYPCQHGQVGDDGEAGKEHVTEQCVTRYQNITSFERLQQSHIASEI